MLKKLIEKKNKGSESGFTIIEVLIVLAIAGLILVVVLIAIPQLQRNQRNTSRQNDASRVAASVSNWVANNNGAVPTSSDLSNIESDIGDLSQYTLPSNATATPPTGIAIVAVTSSGVTADTSLTELTIVTGGKCGTSGAVVQGTPRQFAIQYATENAGSSTVGTAQCLDV